MSKYKYKTRLLKSIIIITLIVLIYIPQRTYQQPTASDNCVSFNSTLSTCQQCMDGFLLLYYFCVPCAPLCICSNTTTSYCQKCMAYQDTSKNVILFAYKTTDKNGDKCVFCNQTIKHCLQCQNTNSNTNTSNNGKESSIKCTKCFQGYFLMPNGLCSIIKCDQNCQICHNQTKCQQCVIGHALNTTSQKCLSSICLQNCLNCTTQSTCSQCNLGYFPNSNNNTCIACLQNCMICNSTTNCTLCYPSFSFNGTQCLNNSSPNCLIYSQGAGNCLICQPGYYNSGGSCNQCNGCYLCNSAFVCYSQCQTGFSPFNYGCLQNKELLAQINFFLLMLIMILISNF